MTSSTEQVKITISKDTIISLEAIAFVKRILVDENVQERWENPVNSSGVRTLPDGIGSYERQIFITWLKESKQTDNIWYSEMSVADTKNLQRLFTNKKIGKLINELTLKPLVFDAVRSFFDYYAVFAAKRSVKVKDPQIEQLISAVIRSSPNYEKILNEQLAAQQSSEEEKKVDSSAKPSSSVLPTHTEDDDDAIETITTPGAATNTGNIKTQFAS